MLKRRSSWVKTAAAVVIVMTMLCPYMAGSTAAQETRKKSYDLSARKAGDVLKLKPEVWTEINRFVFQIAFDIYSHRQTNLELVRQFKRLESYPKLHEACRRWGTVTFPRLQQLAEELSTGDILRLLTDLKSAVERRPNDPVGAEKAFVVAADKLVGKISEWEGISREVKQDLEFLSTQALAAATQLQGTQTAAAQRIVDVRSQVAGVVAALAGVNDHWGALSSDLSVLRKEMATNLNSSDPFMLDITLDIGLTNWESVEGAAKTFMTNVPKQRSYLTGENYYDECPLKEDVWYRMQTKEVLMYMQALPTADVRTGLGTKTLKTSSATYLFLHGQRIWTGEPNPNMQWRFEQMRLGWWRIINRAEGDSKSLSIWDTYNDKENVLGLPRSELLTFPYFPIVNEFERSSTRQRADDPHTRTIQLWRCVPTGERDYFRIYNAYLGEMFSLKMDSYISNIVMSTRMDMSSNAPEQYWRFEAAPGAVRSPMAARNSFKLHNAH